MSRHSPIDHTADQSILLLRRTRLRRFHFTHAGNAETIVLREQEATISQGEAVCAFVIANLAIDLHGDIGTTGLRTWQASVRLANHLLAQPELVQGKRVLELGSGAGMLSVLISKVQQDDGSLNATDYDQAVLERLKANIASSTVDFPHIRSIILIKL